MSSTRFQPGQSGNPAGRPRGIPSKAQKFRAEPEQPEVVSGFKVRLEGVREAVIENDLKALATAELELLAGLGHPGLRHPLSPQQREIFDFEMFDA